MLRAIVAERAGIGAIRLSTQRWRAGFDSLRQAWKRHKSSRYDGGDSNGV